jgi:putative peptidoglycan lipid II flippase
VVRSSAGMAVAALVSRITGLLSKIFIFGVLGFSLVNDAYTLANTLPNIVFELLIGGVLTSVAIPLLTRARSDPDGGTAYTQQLVTVATVGLLFATAVAVAAAPLLIRVYLSGDFQGDPDLAVRLAYLLLPQIFFYGIAALFGAILNTKERFAAPAWAPVVNNLVVIGVAVALAFTVGGFNDVVGVRPDGTQIYGDNPTASQLLILGIGTTAGIIAQAAVQLPSLARSGFRFRWRFRWDARMTEASSLAGWAVLYVVVSQIGYAVFTQLASRQEGGIAQYYWASLLFQTPYGILGVSILTAIMPRMSRHAAADRMDEVNNDLGLATRLSAVALLPVTALLIGLAGAVGVAASLYGGKVELDDAITVGLTCAGLSIGLLPLAISLIQMRVCYAMKDGRTPVVINAAMVAVRIPLLFAALRLDPDWRIPGLAVATALSYFAGAVLGHFWLRHRYALPGTSGTARTILAVTLASVLGGASAAGSVLLVWRDLFPSSLLEAFLQGAVGVSVGGAVFLGVAYLSRVPELEPLFRRLRALLRRRPISTGTVSPAAIDTSDPTMSTVGIEDSTVSTVGIGRHAIDTTEEITAVSGTSTGEDSAEATIPETPIPSPSTGSVVAGSVVGNRYRLVSQVVVDAAGSVYWRAKDTVLPRDMAVTLLPEGPTTNATVTKTLRAGRLHHIGLPQTLDLGTDSGYSFVVGQWVDGATLTDLVAGGPLDSDVAGSITAKIADAVAEAHRNGVSLGALHPSLVRVNFDGQVRFSHVISYSGATQEQDIRAIGAMLYLMLTGTYPLPQTGLSPTLPAAPTRGGREMPADEIGAHASAGLSALADRALHPESAHGVKTAGAVTALLQRADTSSAASSGPITGEVPLTPRQLAEKRLRRERRVKLGVAGAMLTALTVLLAIVVGTVLTRIVDSVQDPVITSDQQLEIATTTLEATGVDEVPITTAESSLAEPSETVPAVVETPVAIVSGEVYDPEGNGTKDYVSYVDRAFDNDPASAWRTFSYRQQFGPTGLKDGVGLLLTLERPVRPTSVVVGTTTPGIRVEIRASDGNINADVTSTPVLATSDVGTSPAAIPIPEDAPTLTHLIVFVVALPGSEGSFEGAISGISVNGVV